MAVPQLKIRLDKKTALIFLLVISGLFLSASCFPISILATDWNTGADQPAQLSDLEVVFGKTLDVIFVLAGIALIVMLIVGGFQYLTSGDNPKATEKASKTLTYAVAGLIIIIAAWLILQAIQAITGLNVTIFKMPK